MRGREDVFNRQSSHPRFFVSSRRCLWWILLCLLPALLVSAQCNAPVTFPFLTDPTPEIQTPTPDNQPRDLLDVVQERGFLKVGVRVWPDAVFKPPLYRAPLGGLDGYEVDIAWALAEHLGVELEMAESDPRRIAAGSWGGEWDIALAWLPITDNAQQALIFSESYAFDAGQIMVHRENESIVDFGGLENKRVGVPSLTVYQQILSGQSPAANGLYISPLIPADMAVIPYNRDGDTVRDLAKGNGTVLDAVLHSRLIVNPAIDADLAIKPIGEPLFWLPIGVVFDRAGMPSERLRIAINDAILQFREDGVLADFSFERYDEDITQLP